MSSYEDLERIKDFYMDSVLLLRVFAYEQTFWNELCSYNEDEYNGFVHKARIEKLVVSHVFRVGHYWSLERNKFCSLYLSYVKVKTSTSKRV
jgi:hypothetical protein